ncbi:hypothetical protein [Lysinibacillus xylanilyticus]|uniref:hypothetical protein n=1 Tax=Lysinibacillus xylanilyticus TaxID=582475 RepID=UPI003CFEB64C
MSERKQSDNSNYAQEKLILASAFYVNFYVNDENMVRHRKLWMTFAKTYTM